MAALSHFPSLFSLSSRNLSFLDQLQTQNQQPKLHCFGHQQHHHRRRECSVCACSMRKSRASRKTKSNDELCNDIREFIQSVGLPEDHVPSTKELSQHGRIDLANIVRRRGHKLIRELLTTNSIKTVESDRDPKNITLTGQDGEVKDVIEDLSSPNRVLVLENISPSLNTNHAFGSDDDNSSPTTTANSSVEEELSNDLACRDEYYEFHRENDDNVEKDEDILKTQVTASEDYFGSSNIGSDVKCNDYSREPTELSTNLSVEKDEYSFECQGEITDNMVDEPFLSPEVNSGENYMVDSSVDEHLEMSHLDCKPMLLTAGSSSKEEALYCSNEQVEKVDNNVDDVSISTEMIITDHRSSDLNIDRALEHEESSHNLIKYSEELSLAEKVAKFIQNGDLDMIDDNFDAILSESGAGKSNGSITAVNAEKTEINSHVKACSEETSSRGSVMASNVSALESEHIMSSTTVDQLIRDDQPSTEALNGQIEKELGAERKGNENQVETDRLKFMLHQKELELSQLKEQIERDKHALSALQSKAETEISKAQKLIFEKDTELLAAEESLSGLEEVHIHYRGDGEIVEVAGSFNGWHHRIKMDSQSSSSVVDSINSKFSVLPSFRTPRLWSTVLWLYPGVYEIKFIVDGHWRIDPHRESVTKGAISNNILRVGR